MSANLRTSRRRWLQGAGGAALSTAFAHPAPDRKPNIVLIVTDDQGWWDLGVHGNRDIETPVMDRLAAEGVSLTRFYASPVCAPTRASLMTGRYYLRTGVYNTRFGGDTMRAEETTIAEVLRAHGYRTGIFGKWHLGRYRRYHPLSRGFDQFLGFSHGHLERYFYPDQLEYNGRPVQARGHITDLLADGAVSFVRAHRSRPFFLYLPFNVPHSPNWVDNRYTERYLKKGVPLNDAQIYGMITHCDEAIGRLLDAIDQEGLRDNTVVLFLTDNGGVSRHFRAGLRGAKGSAYEGGIRVPLFARWPGKFPAGARADAMTSHIDLFPTLCEVAGAPLPSGRPIDGKSLLPLLRKGSGESPHQALFHIWDRHRPGLASNWSVTGPRYKLVRDELFDLSQDPGELRNLAKEHPEIAARMRRQFEDWLADVTRGIRFEPVPIEVGRPDENPVEIQASWASIHGTHVTWSSPGHGRTAGPDPLGSVGEHDALNYTFAGYDWDSIDGWRNPGAAARWKIDVVSAGRYEVTLSYGCHPYDAGGRFRISAGPAQLEGVVEPTVDANVFSRRKAGVLALEKGPAALEVRALSVKNGELMALNRIWLRRLAEA